MKKIFPYLSLAVVFVLIGWFANTAYHLPKNSNPISQIKPTPLYKYSIDSLSAATFKPSEIVVGDVIKDNAKYTSYKFMIKFSPDMSSNLKTTSGMINVPKGAGTFPVIVMYRGYVDQKQYVTGAGTAPSGAVFASNGFITVAPDFLGYAQSDTEAGDIFESRFQTYVTAATILKSLNSIKEWDGKNIFIWGHSNGGQVALTTLEITGVDYPTVLWAPVSKSFPNSILVYSDQADDQGKLIVEKLAEFFDTYDVTKFSLTGYLDKIKAPIEINQGTADTSVPYWWSDSLVKTLKTNKADITYLKYPGADHNLNPSWNQAVNASMLFFKSHLR
jgi:uncharacterized protein